MHLSFRGKRETVASVMRLSGLLAVSDALRFGELPIMILAYHGIRDIVASNYPFDAGMVSASSEQFDLQMNFIKKNFDVISFEDLMKCRNGKISLPKRPMIVTFDDGFSDNYQNAFPILKKYNLPATIFLVSGFVGTREIFWWEKVSYYLKHEKDFFVAWGDWGCMLPKKEAQTQTWVLNYFKDLTEDERSHLLAKMAERFLIEESSDFSLIRPLQWNEVLEMSLNGIEFGSHTVTHPLLSQVSKEKLRFELRESKKEIEQKIKKEVIVLAYPDGRTINYNDEVVLAVKEAGYAFGITYNTPRADNSRSCNDWYRMKRITVDSDHSINRFRCNLTFSSFRNKA